MRFVFFYHSLISDWNHGNAHFLRGIVNELQNRGHAVVVLEPQNGWSLENLTKDHGSEPVGEFSLRFPSLKSRFYSLSDLDLDEVLDGADVVIVHEWNEPELVRRIGQHRLKNKYQLFFHDTHHRAVTDPHAIANCPIENFDGVLAFGNIIREIYLLKGWARRAWTWHEAADTSVFRPVRSGSFLGDVAWVGNWGDEERTAELSDYFIRPVRELGLRANVYGVRYPDEGKKRLFEAGIHYGGWIPNYRVPEILGAHRAAVHIPRRPYVDALPGIPTIRVFEALACRVPLICSEWIDAEGLFTPGKDFLMARTSEQMKTYLRDLICDEAMAAALANHGLNTIRSRHTCTHRVDELLEICDEVKGAADCTSLSLDPA